MSLTAALRSRVKAARRRGAAWVRLIELGRLAATASGCSQLWLLLFRPNEVHQTTTFTAEERYPELFDLVARTVPHARSILSFGCATGEEIEALRRRFPGADIVGAEINPRARRIARRRLRADRRASVVPPSELGGRFDAIFALAVLQREPHKVAESGIQDLSQHYPFARFDDTVTQLVQLLNEGGLLCVANCHYRVEDSSAAPILEAVMGAPAMEGPLFGPAGDKLVAPRGGTLFRKL